MMPDAIRTQDAPAIERLLQNTHRAYFRVRQERDALARSGISRSHLPDDPALMAFALLNDHDRNRVVAEVLPVWHQLLAKGLASGALAETPTCTLRLLAHVLPLIEEVESIWSRLESAGDAPEAPRKLLRCPTRAAGLWGQPISLHFAAGDCAYLMIAPDEVFGRQPTLLPGEASGHLAGAVVFPCESGSVRFTLLTRGGEVYQHVFHCSVKELE